MVTKIKRKYPVDETMFQNITKDSAYWIGYLYGDGNCTCSNKVRLCCAERDKELLIAFRAFIKNITKPIKSFVTSNGYSAVRYEVSSWKMIKDLSKYELNKTKNCRGRLHPDLVQKDISKDFVRGVFDADGAFYYDGLHKNNLFAEITGYFPALLSIKQILVSANVISEKKHIVKNGRIFRLRLAKEDCIRFIKYIYKDSPRYFLKRKYGIAKNYLDRLNERTYND